MFHKLAHGRIFGLVIGLAAATAATAAAQDTSAQGTRDQNDTSQVQNPPGYSGMERDTTLVPPSATQDSVSPSRAEDRATGTYDDSTWQDTSKARQYPAGYRGMERPAGADTSAAKDSAQSDTSASDTSAMGVVGDTTTGDTTAVGQTTPRKSEKPEARPPTAGGDTTGQSSGTGADTTSD
jgi:hypothetical protein